MREFSGRNGPSALSLTGERTLPGLWHERYWFARHEIAYRHAGMLLAKLPAPTIAQRQPAALDAGCGEGYGAEHLRAITGALVVGVDYDAATVAHLRDTYPHVRAVRGNLVALPLRPRCVDAVVSLQTVEHVWDQPAFAAECVRVLRPGGVLVVSTPNRLTFSPGLGRGQRPTNPFHVNELDADELAALLGREPVHDVQVLGVHHGPRLAAQESAHGSLVSAMLAQPYEEWDVALAAFVRTVAADDFVVTAGSSAKPLDRSLDLIAVGWAQ